MTIAASGERDKARVGLASATRAFCSDHVLLTKESNMSAKHTTPKADRNHGKEEISLKAGRLFELVHKAHVGSPVSIAVVLLLLILGNLGAFVGFGWAADRAGLPEQACQGLAFGLLVLALVPSFLIIRGMLQRQSEVFPKQVEIPKKLVGWEKPPEKLKSVEKNSRRAIAVQGKPPGVVPKQSVKGRSGKRKKAAQGR